MHLRLKSATKKELQRLGIAFVYLFGSIARDQAHTESDVDIGIVFIPQIPNKEYLQREGATAAVLQPYFPKREINIVNLALVSPLLKQTAIIDGVLLYQREQYSSFHSRI